MVSRFLLGGVGGRPATTGFRVLGTRRDDVQHGEEGSKDEEGGGGGGSGEHTPVLLELTPQTGRKHQLRVHCAHVLKCPMVGDYKHGYRDLRRRRFRNKVPEWWGHPFVEVYSLSTFVLS